MFPPDYFAFIWFQGLSFIRDDVSCDWKDVYLTKNEKIVVPNLRVDIFSFRVFSGPIIVYINHDPRMTLTYFTARST